MGNKYKCIKGHFTDKEHEGKDCPYDNLTTEELESLSKNKVDRKVKYPEVAYGFSNNERLKTAHHTSHAKDMGFKNQKEYEKAAVEFFNGNLGKLYYGARRDRFYRYDANTGFFCVSSNGVIHTFLEYNEKKFKKVKEQEGLYEI